MFYLCQRFKGDTKDMAKLLKDPLVHFLLVGAAIFGLSYWLNPPTAEGDTGIIISAADVAKMRDQIALIQGRSATDEEVNALIEVQIREEVLYREAMAMGLDRDDTMVRNRLIEKMRFLTENVGEPPLPNATELEMWFNVRQEQFRIPSQVTFEHVFFAIEHRGERTESDAAAVLPRLRARREALTPAQLAAFGDPLPLWNRYDNMSQTDVALAFGEEFATAIAPLEAGTWSGPIRSRFGWHVVRVVDRTAERQPPLAEIQEAVQTAYLNEQRQAGNEARYRAMRERYDVTVEAAGAAPTEPVAAEPQVTEPARS